MPIFLRYLLSLIFHMTWSRVGKGAPVPPVRLPRKGKGPVTLPAIGPWQLMMAMWLVNKIWGKYGNNVKSHLLTAPHPAAKGLGSLLPDPQNAGTSTLSSTTPSVATPALAPPAGASTAPAAANPPHMSTHVAGPSGSSHQPPSHDTQRLPGASLPQGSVLSALRGSSLQSQPDPDQTA